jgi:hypothetical protein
MYLHVPQAQTTEIGTKQVNNKHQWQQEVQLLSSQGSHDMVIGSGNGARNE